MIKTFFQEFFYYLTYPIRAIMMPDRWVFRMRRITNVSMPVGVSLIVALFLVVCVVTFFIITRTMGRDLFYDLPWWKGAPVVVLLVIIIPIVTYYCIKLWMEGEWSAFEDIDRAWKAGVAELTRNGLDLRRTPIFLVHGTESSESETQFFAASGLSLTVENFPSGPSALHWYANRDGVYLVCSDVGCLSHLAAKASQLEDEASTMKRPRPDADASSGIRATVWPSELRPPEPVAKPVEFQAPARGPVGGDDIRGTMFIDPEMEARVAQQASAASPSKKGRLTFDRREVDLQRRRMEHLCRLIRRARRPLCPVNGMLSVLPINMLLADDEEGGSTKEAARVDIDTLVKTLQLRCPVMAVVAGWEAETGFHELIRRLPPESARRERFGKGFDVWAPPATEEIGALCKQACGAFEDWVYYLFKERDALRRPGNRLLYALLCRVRLYLETRLDRILVGTFAQDSVTTTPTAQPQTEPMLFAGCYFAAAGSTEDRQAFVRSVMNKLPDQQEELEWIDKAVRDDQRYRLAAWIGWTLVLALVIAEGAMLYFRLNTGGHS